MKLIHVKKETIFKSIKISLQSYKDISKYAGFKTNTQCYLLKPIIRFNYYIIPQAHLYGPEQGLMNK